MASRNTYQVPDFFMSVKYDHRIVNCLVEVKKQDLNLEAQLDKDHLRFTRAYHDRLANYAQLLGLPLLIAWKAEPFSWFCFDMTAMKKIETAYRISAGDALLNNLLGLLFGDFSFHLRPNASFVMKIERLTDGKKQFEGTIRDVYWQAFDGGRVSLESEFFDLFMFSPDNVESTDADGFVTQRFYKVETSGAFSQRLLHLAAHGYAEQPSSWIKAVEKGFRYSLPDLRRCAEDAAKKGMIETVIEIAPVNCPAFLMPSSGKAPRSLLLVGRGGVRAKPPD